MKKILKFLGMVVLCIIAGSVIGFIGFKYYNNNDTENAEIVSNVQAEQISFENLPSEDEVFAKFTAEYWENISVSEIELICDELSVLIRYDLRIDNPIEIDMVYNPDAHWFGCQLQKQNRVQINLYNIYKEQYPFVRIVNTLAHEHRHVYQEQRVKQGYKTKLEESYQNYITPEVSYTGYYNQLVEVDARNYGSYWENMLKKWLVA